MTPLKFLELFLSQPDYWKEWVLAPQTWVAVLAPALISTLAFFRQGTTRVELGLLLTGILATLLNSRWEVTAGALSLYSANWFPTLLVILYGLRLYKATPLKLAAVAWVSLTTTDVLSTIDMAHENISLIEFPIGIGGAGAGDALFVVPVIIFFGGTLLNYVREWGARQPVAPALPKA